MADLQSDDDFHRAYVGPAGEYDFAAAWQFNLLTLVFGLREYHHLLEIGCGSLRAGRLFIPYLLRDHYCGLEPNEWLVRDGIDKEVGADLVRLKRPLFRSDDDFSLSRFGRTFDFVLAQSVFSHTAKSQIASCLVEARRVLKPDGLLVATFLEGQQDYGGDAWVYPDCVEFTWNTMVQLAADRGLGCRPLDWGNPNGQKWVIFHHAESELAIPALDAKTAAERACAALERGRSESAQRRSSDPAEYVRLRERMREVDCQSKLPTETSSDPERSTKLEADHIIHRHVLASTPPHVEYSISQHGLTLCDLVE